MKLALIHILSDDDRGSLYPDQGLPGGGGHPSNRPIHHPGHPDHGLPSGGGGARPSQPIYHPGHPDHGLPAFPSQGLPPYSPGSPDNSLPVPPGITPPDAPADMDSKLIVLWRLPNTVEWHGKAMDPSNSPDQGLPPTGAPKY
jgi:hypothetical protein